MRRSSRKCPWAVDLENMAVPSALGGGYGYVKGLLKERKKK